MKNLIAVTLVLAAAAGCGRLGGGGAPKTEDDKTLYALGMIIGRNLADFNLTPRELDIVKAGMTDTVQKKKPAVDLETYGPKVDALHARSPAGARGDREEAGQGGRRGRGAEPGAVKTAVGRDRPHRQAGHRRDAAADRSVKVHYTGKLIDGTVFDSSRKRGGSRSRFRSTASSSAGPRAWGAMKVGEQAMLTCPSDIAYGDGGRANIPPGATLIFDVELLGIERSKSAALRARRPACSARPAA